MAAVIQVLSAVGGDICPSGVIERPTSPQNIISILRLSREGRLPRLPAPKRRVLFRDALLQQTRFPRQSDSSVILLADVVTETSFA